MAFLDNIPDMQDQSSESILDWVKDCFFMLTSADFTPDVMKTFAPVELPAPDPHPLGPEASVDWRRFCLGVLLADWACYADPFDRIDLPRLKYILSSASQYFRLWVCTLPDGRTLPVGYSAWYPISKFIYDRLLDNTDEINDRGAFLPLRFRALEDVRYGYALNVSIVEPLRNTFCSTRLVRSYQRDALRLKHVNAVTLTVDEAGSRISRLCQFTELGNIDVQGHAEGLFLREAPEA